MARNSRIKVTLQRAQERVDRVASAPNERDADHLESEAMGYLSALRDERLLPELEIDGLMLELQQVRQAWLKLKENPMPTKSITRPLSLRRRRRALNPAAQARRVSALLTLYGVGCPPAALQLIASAGVNAITSAATADAAHDAYDKTMVAVRLKIGADGVDPREGEALAALLSDLRNEQIRALLRLVTTEAFFT